MQNPGQLFVRYGLILGCSIALSGVGALSMMATSERPGPGGDRVWRSQRARRAALLRDVVPRRLGGVRVVLEDVRSANAASILRTCDALGIPEVYWIHNPRKDERGFGRNEFSPEELTDVGRVPAIVKASMGMSWFVGVTTFLSSEACLEALKADGFRNVATSLRGGSVPLGDATFLEGRTGAGGRGATEDWSRVALWFGHEGNGLGQAALAGADEAVHIPMRGSGDSLGVSAAVPIVCHELVRRRQAAGTLELLGAGEQAALLARLMPPAVDPAEGLATLMSDRAVRRRAKRAKISQAGKSDRCPFAEDNSGKEETI